MPSKCLRPSMVARLGLAAVGIFAALLLCADARSLRLSAQSNTSSVPHATSHDTLQYSQGSGGIERVWSAACALVATEPLLHSGPSCSVFERSQPHAAGIISHVGSLANGSLAADAFAWQPLVVIGCGDFLGNIVRGVTGAASLAMVSPTCRLFALLGVSETLLIYVVLLCLISRCSAAGNLVL